ncbi:hypothetical protein PC9H_007275 [Pleurotus ostreatus]|uniref:gluconokinase n=1 Tax=Pleurotus ostreatus TaxID=5322 RepID=A0A8H7DQ15_PLEOS|nr:uncharacterized protein PC9H_007275 [Pleurotus ostreatus]KAF7428056.1 hypothetical protein PC9H_007275 [Pleurotus ostreatus]KAJ8696108.1 hypothetical protein PTI98_006001 [Pleurotus ostreatus]
MCSRIDDESEKAPSPSTRTGLLDISGADVDVDGPFCVIVMGVSGTGKSTLGSALATALGVPFIDGDDLHPESNVTKMASGQPLNDADREPWLELIRTRAEEICNEEKERAEERILDGETSASPEGCHMGVVIVCSSLKKYYRDILRGEKKPATDTNRIPEHLEPPHPDALPTYFAFIKGDRETLMKRMLNRQGHFMKANMLDSQLNTLESPEGEGGVIVVDARQTTEQQVETIRAGLRNERKKADRA